MKSPVELKAVLRRQWESATKRETRLLGQSDMWPIVLSIGRPKPRVIASDLDAVKRHVDLWRRIDIGEVIWESVSYRATADSVDMPLCWRLHQPSDWVAACADRPMRKEFESMSVFAEQTDPCFHSLLIRRRSLWRDKPVEAVLQAARLALALEPRCVNGRPLRAFSLEGIETKFIEQNASLVTALLDVRFDSEVSRIGLEVFLGATSESDHWLLLMDLDGSLLPFQKQRVRCSELRNTPLPGRRLLVVENESCQYQLPDLPETIGVLGAGFDLAWTAGSWLQTKQIGYWGDIDTWGLQFLANTRRALPHLDALMMTPEIYDQNIDSAVPEPVIAGTDLPTELNDLERSLYQRLLKEPRGRLEQEFLPEKTIHQAIRDWCDC